MNELDPFIQRFRGGFSGVLRWPQLDALWQTLHADAEKQWFIYAIGETPPRQPSSASELETFIQEVDHLLRTEHDEDYCGIVYADNQDDPAFIKIYDPNNLGVVCGFSNNPPLPGWVLSLQQPVDLPAVFPPPGNRRRWWKKLIGTG